MTKYLGGEKGSVQNPLIGYVKEPSFEYKATDGKKIQLKLGWDYVEPEEALKLRGGKPGLVFKEIFINQMLKLNPDFMTVEMAEELIKKLERIPPTIEGNLITWEYLKGLRTVFVPKEKRERNVTFLDTKNINNNTFHVTDEFSFTNGTKTNRADVVFLINSDASTMSPRHPSNELLPVVRAIPKSSP